MALELIHIDFPEIEPTEQVQSIMDRTDESIAKYLQRNIQQRASRFVPCDSLAVFRALQWLYEERIATGENFCEWGSGFGMVAAIASAIGFESTGIELEGELVEEAVQISQNLGLGTNFICDNFIPNGFEYADNGKDEAGALTPSGMLPSEQLSGENIFENDIDIHSFDIIYAFPWPGEEELVIDLFDAVAEEDMLLLTYCQTNGVLLRRKV